MKKELIFAMFFFLFIFLFFLQSMTLPFMLPNGLLASGFFPRILTVLILLLTLCYIVSLIRKMKKEKPVQEKKVNPRSIVSKQLFLVVAMALAIFLGEYLGVTVTTGLFLLVTLVFIEKLSWLRSAIFSISTSVSIYLIFEFALNLNLPKGIFG
ncbi:tripartite tricarboxylate transporter TctB family protein [Metabacillus arenae]|uniref:Tripartite tricarboxylate transporter TctB family protein n=1 Tax=Metabacillus arenae TaxID=2771434 RepID=A0A926RYI5_9BACI|nr:tripartite tricarboxylate transporter TctB family protein [Metabacillus arenae]MBD1381785.1 tripartite tricarboxylate transporter TctB family protein [Metabacillus arenae]